MPIGAARRLARSLKLCEGLTDEEIGGVIAEDQARQLGIRRELADLDRRSTRQGPTAAEAIEAVSARLRVLPRSWKELPRRELKDFLKAVVEELKIDLGTLETTMIVRVPERATNPLPKCSPGSRLTFASAWSCLHDAGSAEDLKTHRVV